MVAAASRQRSAPTHRAEGQRKQRRTTTQESTPGSQASASTLVCPPAPPNPNFFEGFVAEKARSQRRLAAAPGWIDRRSKQLPWGKVPGRPRPWENLDQRAREGQLALPGSEGAAGPACLAWIRGRGRAGFLGRPDRPLRPHSRGRSILPDPSSALASGSGRQPPDPRQAPARPLARPSTALVIGGLAGNSI